MTKTTFTRCSRRSPGNHLLNIDTIIKNTDLSQNDRITRKFHLDRLFCFSKNGTI